MIFLLDSNLFHEKQSRTVDLLTFLRLAARRAHTVFVVESLQDPNLDSSEALERWLSTLDGATRAETQMLLDETRRIAPNASTRGAFVVLVENDLTSATDYGGYLRSDLSTAIRISCLPLYVLLENGLSDAAFLRRVLPKAWRVRLAEWEQWGFIQFENGGGVDEMVRIVGHYSTGRAPEPLGLGKIAWRATHVLISDRDSHADGSESAKCKRLKNVCADSNMGSRVHVLRRRDQESYIPREALNKIVAGKTDVSDRERMAALLATHFADAFDRLHKELPRLGEGGSWFKNAFLSTEIEWDDQWFASDGSADEMTEIAELIASFI